MAKDFSFDIVSDFDLSEMHNAIDQAKREMANRYDFKGTSADLTFDPKEGPGGALMITGDNDFQLDSILDIIRKKLATRNLSQKILDTSKTRETSNLKTHQQVPLRKGLDQEKAKQIAKRIRDQFPKVKSQIQGTEVRVSSSNKDELQKVIKAVQETPLDFPVNFVNYR